MYFLLLVSFNLQRLEEISFTGYVFCFPALDCYHPLIPSFLSFILSMHRSGFVVYFVSFSKFFLTVESMLCLLPWLKNDFPPVSKRKLLIIFPIILVIPVVSLIQRFILL